MGKELLDMRIMKVLELTSFMVYFCDPDSQWIFRRLLDNLAR